MPDPKDFLPPPPWEGPPVPPALRKAHTQDISPATPSQIRYIARLCSRLGIEKPLEEQVKSMGEAGRLIRELEAELEHRKRSRLRRGPE